MTRFQDLLNSHQMPGAREARAEMRRLKVIWAVACATPVLYLLIAHGVDVMWFREASEGLMTLSPVARRNLAWGFAAIVTLTASLLLVLRLRPLAEVAGGEANLAPLARSFRRRIITMVVLSDLIACMGLILYLLTADLRAVLLGGIAAYACYAISYPARPFFAKAAKLL